MISPDTPIIPIWAKTSAEPLNGQEKPNGEEPEERPQPEPQREAGPRPEEGPRQPPRGERQPPGEDLPAEGPRPGGAEPRPHARGAQPLRGGVEGTPAHGVPADDGPSRRVLVPRARELAGKDLWARLSSILEQQLTVKGRKVTFTKDTVQGLFQLVAWRRPAMRGKGDRDSLDMMLSRLNEAFVWARPDDASDAILSELVEVLG